MKRPHVYLASILALAACAAAEAPSPLAVGEPYREPVDQCRWVTERAALDAYARPEADLVACPADYDGIGIFVMDVNARPVGRWGAWQLFEVPHP
ncbi:hypothetical protein [Tranquillimonas alkanivorans]|uniref:Uncharacterized protein n=1 Tax=Tranquillimonas alkanivorans TaxID=441119 RepID=A0A1I5TE17_9RHOB|nr:hypothetical protein [Tranquillimonas alkanivorans]SFP81208.1 hypothetical protein SAMN04488047_11371 [Tranquillimonas alkanivorans]